MKSKTSKPIAATVTRTLGLSDAMDDRRRHEDSGLIEQMKEMSTAYAKKLEKAEEMNHGLKAQIGDLQDTIQALHDDLNKKKRSGEEHIATYSNWSTVRNGLCATATV